MIIEMPLHIFSSLHITFICCDEVCTFQGHIDYKYLLLIYVYELKANYYFGTREESFIGSRTVDIGPIFGAHNLFTAMTQRWRRG